MKQFTINPIGQINTTQEGMCIQLEDKYIPALQELDSFSHVNIFWWFDGCDDAACRSCLEAPSPYRGSPAVMGTFATRSPMRPNPIALTVAEITFVDKENGIVGISYTDAHDGTPVVDLKPYTPSLDRVENPGVPAWCADWPKSLETSGDFDWESVFNFA